MSDRPPFHQLVLEQLEIAAKRIDLKYWHALKSFQIDYTGPDTLSPTKTPVLLRNELTMYAGALFRLEADQYPKNDGNYAAWLVTLSNRITARILHAVEELEASEGTGKLSYHGLSVDAMREGLQVFLALVVFEYAGISMPILPPTAQRKAQKASAEPETESNPEVARRAALLAEYKAATRNVSNKRIYEAQNSGIHKPEFYRWVSADLPDTSIPARRFERFLASKKMPIPRKPKS
jgi:hypothetical protein